MSSILYVISASKVPAKSASVALISCTNVPTPEFSEIAVIKKNEQLKINEIIIL